MKKKEKEKLCSLYIQISNKIYGPHPLPPFCWGGGSGVESPTKFSKRVGGLDRTSTFRGGC